MDQHKTIGSGNGGGRMNREEYVALLESASMTAGSDNWKTRAGRLDGPDEFVLKDAFRYVGIRMRRWNVAAKHTTGVGGGGVVCGEKVCPVCLEDPTADNDNDNDNGWYMTKSCNHAVCVRCLRSYASSLSSDPNHNGPLRCPCCPRDLRVDDARFALSSPSGDEALSVLRKWDRKVRDDFLRWAPDFRPCPRCGKGGGGGGGNDAAHRGGGGFVTPECLRPINEARESEAERLMGMAAYFSTTTVLLVYALYYFLCVQRSSSSSSASSGPMPTRSELAQVAVAIVPCVLVLALSWTFRLVLSKKSRRQIQRPIEVGCPCCQQEFHLEGHLAFDESATKKWKNVNTRPCPGCASPIMKDGGCNHVKCGRCRVDFCWNCMRTRTKCQAYRCSNGAPYGSVEAAPAGLAEGMTLMERIDLVEHRARNNLQALSGIPMMSWVVREARRSPFVAASLVVSIAAVGPSRIVALVLSINLRVVVTTVLAAVIIYSLVLALSMTVIRWVTVTVIRCAFVALLEYLFECSWS